LDKNNLHVVCTVDDPEVYMKLMCRRGVHEMPPLEQVRNLSTIFVKPVENRRKKEWGRSGSETHAVHH
jgi:hypothetical protein